MIPVAGTKDPWGAGNSQVSESCQVTKKSADGIACALLQSMEEEGRVTLLRKPYLPKSPAKGKR